MYTLCIYMYYVTPNPNAGKTPRGGAYQISLPRWDGGGEGGGAMAMVDAMGDEQVNQDKPLI